jgi:hypothetical protein
MVVFEILMPLCTNIKTFISEVLVTDMSIAARMRKESVRSLWKRLRSYAHFSENGMAANTLSDARNRRKENIDNKNVNNIFF